MNSRISHERATQRADGLLNGCRAVPGESPTPPPENSTDVEIHTILYCSNLTKPDGHPHHTVVGLLVSAQMSSAMIEGGGLSPRSSYHLFLP